MSPALALSILNPKLVFSEGEGSAGVQQGVLVTRGDGRQLSPYDLKRLQVGALLRCWCVWCVGCSVVFACHKSVLAHGARWTGRRWTVRSEEAALLLLPCGCFMKHHPAGSVCDLIVVTQVRRRVHEQILQENASFSSQTGGKQGRSALSWHVPPHKHVRPHATNNNEQTHCAHTQTPCGLRRAPMQPTPNTHTHSTLTHPTHICIQILQAYSSNLVDYHLILDLLPSLARLYLSGQLPATLSYGQVCVCALERVECVCMWVRLCLISCYGRATCPVCAGWRSVGHDSQHADSQTDSQSARPHESSLTILLALIMPLCGCAVLVCSNPPRRRPSC